MNYKSSAMCYCCLLAVCLHLATGRVVTSRDDGKLDHRIGDLFQRLSTTSVSTDNNNNKRPLSSVMKSDIHAAILILRQSQLQIQTVLSAQKKMLEKLHHWQSKLDEDVVATVLQKVSTGQSSQIKPSKVDFTWSVVKETSSVLKETQIHMASVLVVNGDLQERLAYWQVHNGQSSDNPPIRPCTPAEPGALESKLKWIQKALKCNSSLHEAFWILPQNDWDWRSKSNLTALEHAVHRNSVILVDVLIKGGADCWTRDGKETLLHQTIKDGTDGRIVRLLVKGCDVNATDATHKTPLHLVAEWDRLDIVQPLLQQSANLEAQDLLGFRPLHLAVRSPKMVAALLASGADIEARTVSGMTPLHLAVIENQLETAKLLIKDGAKVGVVRDVYGHTPLDYAAMLGQRGGSRDKDMRTLLEPFAVFDENLLNMPSE